MKNPRQFQRFALRLFRTAMFHAVEISRAKRVHKKFLAHPGKIVRYGSNVKRFSEALKRSITQIGMTQAQLAETAQIGTGQLSKYVNGRLPADTETLRKIVGALPMPQCALVLAGYLEDLVPEGAEGTVTITPNALIKKGALPKRVSAALKRLADRAERDESLQELLVLINETLRPE